jgi:hypothetical protein
MALGGLPPVPMVAENDAILSGLSPTQIEATPFGVDHYRAKVAEKLGAIQTPAVSWAEGFTKSALWSAGPELIGMDIGQAWPDIERWRLRNPGATLLSHLVGGVPTFVFPGPRLAGAVARGLPPLQKAFSVANDWQAAGKVFRAGALRETTRFTPLFGAQALGSVVAPQEGTVGRTAQMLAFEIPAFALFGGLGSVFANRVKGVDYPAGRRGEAAGFAGIEAKLAQETAYPINQPLQSKHQFLTGLLERGAKDNATALQINPLRGLIDQAKLGLESQIIQEEFLKKPIRRLVQGLPLTNRLNALYTPGQQSGVVTRQLESLDEASSLIGFNNWFGVVQGPRLLETTSQKGSARIHSALADMQHIAKGTWMAEEGAEGAYVILKNIPGVRTPGTGGLLGLPAYTRDRWLLLKTTQPQKFAEGGGSLHERLAEVFLKKDLHVRADPSVPKAATPTLTSAESQEQLLRPIQQAMHGTARATDENGMVQHVGSFARMMDRWLPRVVVENRRAAVEAGRGAGTTLQGGLSPALHEVSNNPRAVAISAHTQSMLDEMMLKINTLLHGQPVLGAAVKERGVLRGGIFSTKPKFKGGVLEDIDEFTRIDEEQFTRAWMMALSPDEAFSKGYSDRVVGVLRRLNDEVDDPFIKELAATRKALGIDDAFTPMKWHYHLSRTWLGDFRLPIYDLAGKPVGMGSGYTRRQAIDEANLIIERVNASLDEPALLRYERFAELGDEAVLAPGGRVVKVREVGHGLDEEVLRVKDNLYVASSTDPRARDAGKYMKEADIFQVARDIDADNAMAKRIMAERVKLFDEDPGRFAKRRDQLGFAGSTRALTKSEIKERVAANVVESQRLLTKESWQSVLTPEMTRLAAEDMTAFNRIMSRFNASMGIQGPVARAIDHQMDKILAPVFGPRAASKAVRTLNQGLFFLTLGAGDLGFATLNAMTPLQTVLPEIAFALSTPPERMAGYYSAALFNTGRGVRPVNFLDPIRVMKRTLQDLGRNADDATKAAQTRAATENIITRQGVEAYMGADIREIGRLGKVFTGGESMIDWIKALSATPVALSEEFARAYAFTAGRRLYLDFMAPSRLAGQALEDAAFEFARRFTLRTNFGYGTADRPRILTGSIGTGWGLFRNWTFNYLHNLATYTNAGFGRNNFRPLLWSMMGTSAVGGVAAMPFYGMASGFSKLTTDKSLETQMYEMMGGGPDSAYAADMLMYGPLSALRFTLQSRASVPGTEFLRDMSMMANMLLLDRSVALGKTFGVVGQNVAAGRNPFNDDRFVRHLMQFGAPRSMQRAWQVWDGNFTSLNTGNVLAADVPKFEAIATALGFQSTDVRKLFSVSDELYKDQQAKRELLQAYGGMLDQAWTSGDARDVNGIIWRAHTAGLDLSSLVRSAQSRRRKREGDLLDRQFDDWMVMAYRRIRGLGY